MRGEMRALSGALLAAVIAVGCATSGDAEQARKEAAEANRKAEMAVADAAAARTAAEDAAKSAREANEKADRIFQRSLHK